MINGYWSDQHTAYLRRYLPPNTAYFEEAINHIHHEPQGSEQAIYLDLIELCSSLLALVSGPLLILKNEDIEKLNGLQSLTTFLTPKILSRLAFKNFYQYHFYRFFFKYFVKPQVAFFVPAYGREAIVLALKSLGVKVIELQHGAITTKHYGYTYIPNTVKTSGPHYLLVYGQYWIDRLKGTTSVAQNIQVLGSHEFHQTYSQGLKEPNNRPHTQILFLSQLRNRLVVRNAYQVVKNRLSTKRRVKCVYRPHPREASLGMAEHSKQSLHEALAESGIVVGVYSTAMYEAIATGKAVICLRAEGSSELENEYLAQYLKFADSLDELVQIIHDILDDESHRVTCSSNYIFASFDRNLLAGHCDQPL